MPGPSNVQLSAPIRPVAIPAFDLVKAVRSIKIEEVRNAPPPTFTYCQVPCSGDGYFQRAVGHSISICYDIFAESRAGLSHRESVALNRTMEWLGPRSAEHIGLRMLHLLLYSGALRAALDEMLKTAPTDRALLGSKRKLEAAILRAGVRAGRCPKVPDGFFHGDEKTLKLAKSLVSLRKCMAEVALKHDKQELFSSMTRAVVARTILDSAAVRAPGRLNASTGGQVESVPDISKWLAWELIEETEAKIDRIMELGQPEYAIFDLLKLGEYVLRERQGQSADA